MFLILFAALIFGCAQAEVTALNDPVELDDPAMDLMDESEEHLEDKQDVFPEYIQDLMEGEWPEDAFRNNTDEIPWDIDSLVSVMTKGDAKLTAFIVKKIGELRGKTWAQHKVINSKLKRKLADLKKKIAFDNAAKKVSDGSAASYSQAVKDAAYDYAQISQECQSYDRIMAKLNEMKDWKKCPSGWTQVGRSCYKVIGRARAYLQEFRCLKIGASLVRVDNQDDKNALKKLCTKYKAGKTETHCQVGFFRQLKTGNWEYVDGQSVNPASWYRWAGSTYNNKAYNYAGWYGPNKHNYALTWASGWGALCEHRLAVNLLK